LNCGKYGILYERKNRAFFLITLARGHTMKSYIIDEDQLKALERSIDRIEDMTNTLSNDIDEIRLGEVPEVVPAAIQRKLRDKFYVAQDDITDSLETLKDEWEKLMGVES